MHSNGPLPPSESEVEDDDKVKKMKLVKAIELFKRR
jgi:hypothetical protein